MPHHITCNTASVACRQQSVGSARHAAAATLLLGELPGRCAARVAASVGAPWLARPSRWHQACRLAAQADIVARLPARILCRALVLVDTLLHSGGVVQQAGAMRASSG